MLTDEDRAYHARYIRTWTVKQTRKRYERKLAPCLDCALRFHPCAMHYDHVRGLKVAHVSELPIHKMDWEMSKTELVCANCHAIRGHTRVHGGRCPTEIRPTVRKDGYALVYLHKSDPCCDCGKRYHLKAMQFDHVRGAKCFELSKWYKVRATDEMILDEIAKCDLVCANCHEVRTRVRYIGAEEFRRELEMYGLC